MWIKDNKAHDDDDFNTASEDYDSYSKSRQKSNLMLQKDFDFESRMYLRPKKCKAFNFCAALSFGPKQTILFCSNRRLLYCNKAIYFTH